MKLKHEVKDVQVLLHGSFQPDYTLGCAYDGARYHVWVERATLQIQSRTHDKGPKIYKNPPLGTPYERFPKKGSAYFRTRELGVQTDFGTALIVEMRRIADRDQLWKKAEDERIEAERVQAEAHRVAVANTKAKEAGPQLLAAAIGALKLLRSVQHYEIEIDQMPYPEIVELENAITEAGGNAKETEPANANS